TYDCTYIKHEGQLIGQECDNELDKWILTDHLGSATVTTNSIGEIVENTSYEPFGEILSGGEESRYDYEAKEFDDTIGEYDFHFRMYKPDWGIFAKPDTLIQGTYRPQTLNRYSFEQNNPYYYVDPTGHFYCAPYGCVPEIIVTKELIFLGVAALASVGLISYAAYQNSQEVDYDYEYGYAGPEDAMRKRVGDNIDELEKMQEMKDRGDALQGLQSCDSEGNCDDIEPYEPGYWPPGMLPNPNYAIQILNDAIESNNAAQTVRQTGSSRKGSYRSSRGRSVSYRLDRNDDGDITGGNVAGFEMSEGFAKKFEEAMKDYPDYFS
ncbi:hypothetical protein GF327_08855, partial [Candidatus Woesearchaeota archaeon]|nr:hypothetical protein [Candidatus Woesearchaeota archaeon]